MVKILRIFFLIILFSVYYSSNAQQPLLVEYLLDKSVISFEVYQEKYDSLNNIIKYHYDEIASGFFIGGCEESKGYKFLITCKHVIDTIYKKFDGRFYLRFPYLDSLYPIKSYRGGISLNDNNGSFIIYSDNNNYDIAIFVFDSIKFFDFSPYYMFAESNKKLGVLPFSAISKNPTDIHKGYPIILVGYPFGLQGTYKNYLIYRKGIISAVIDDNIGNIEGLHYLGDINSEGGDSGGAVFLDLSIYGKLPQLIGIHSGNFFKGLTIIEPISEVIRLINQYLEDK